MHILAIDQGTTNTKALVINPEGKIIASYAQQTPISYPQLGWVEQDGREIWHCTLTAINGCLAQVPHMRIAAVAISNQRETALVWERASGQPVGPCVVWQCRRSAPFCNELKSRGLANLLHQRTGLQVDPMFSGSKIRWLLDHIDNGRQRAEQGELCVGTIDSWLLWNLTGGAVHATDATNASRTQLLNLSTVTWDSEVLDIFQIPAIALPHIYPSSYIYGETVAHDHLPAGIPIASLIGDSHASLFGLGGFQPGSIKATYGTGSSIMMPTVAPILSMHGLSTTIAWARQHTIYALEGNIYATGAAVSWLGSLLGLDSLGIEKLACSVPSSNGVYFVPALVGLGAPHWQENVRGVICGLNINSGPGHVARATIEAIAYQVRDVFDVMRVEAGTPIQTLLADGGATRNDLLMQFQADILGCSVLRSVSPDMSPLGAAFLAGLAIGLWTDETEIAKLLPPRDRFDPKMAEDEREELYQGWRAAVARTIYRPPD